MPVGDLATGVLIGVVCECGCQILTVGLEGEACYRMVAHGDGGHVLCRTAFVVANKEFYGIAARQCIGMVYIGAVREVDSVRG